MNSRVPDVIEPAGDGSSLRAHRIRGALFALIFIGVFLLLDYGYRYVIGTIGQRVLIDAVTIPAAAALINLCIHGAHVWSSGHTLLMPTGAIIVNPGCEGTEGMFLIIAAVIAVRAKLLWSIAGIVGGVVLMYLLNLIRLFSFYIALQYHRAWFEALHDLIGPTIIIAVGLLYFALWMNRVTMSVDD